MVYEQVSCEVLLGTCHGGDIGHIGSSVWLIVTAVDSATELFHENQILHICCSSNWSILLVRQLVLHFHKQGNNLMLERHILQGVSHGVVIPFYLALEEAYLLASEDLGWIKT